jgi:hypothetical protein
MIMAENLIIAGSLQENNRKAGLASAGKWPARNQRCKSVRRGPEKLTTNMEGRQVRRVTMWKSGQTTKTVLRPERCIGSASKAVIMVLQPDFQVAALF